MHGGVFQEVTGLHPFEERRGIQEIIIDPLPLSRTRLAGGASDSAREVGPGHEELLADRGFAAARRGGKNDQQGAVFFAGHGIMPARRWRPRVAGQRAARRRRTAADPTGLPLGRVDHWRWEDAWP